MAIEGNGIREQAKLLARENKTAEPGIRKVYWFPDAEEIRLVELEDDFVASLSGEVEPFYFAPSPEDGLEAPSAIDIIRTDEFGRLRLPEGWGSWEGAEELAIEG